MEPPYVGCYVDSVRRRDKIILQLIVWLAIGTFVFSILVLLGAIRIR